MKEGFDSPRDRHKIYGPLAQLVEQFPFKEWVDGSSPSRLTILVPVVQLDRIRVS